METVASVALAGFLGYLVYDEFLREKNTIIHRKRLCDYYVSGTVFEDIPSAIQRGCRLLEVHLYADEQGHPVIAKHPLQQGYDYALDNISFEQCCNEIGQNAFPNPDPFILSIVPHTENTITLNRAAEHLKTCSTRRRLLEDKNIARKNLDEFADKLIIASGDTVRGTDLETLVNISWSESDLRRLSYNQAVHSRDQSELVGYNRDHISIVAPDPAFGKSGVNPDTPFAYGCQWNLFPSSMAPGGFVEKHVGLQ
jgi:Phosphatidylinositol-specific phospholipase C, X domain